MYGLETVAPERLHGVLPVVRTDKDGRPFTVRSYAAADRPALEEFYRTFEPKRAAQGLPPQGEDRIGRWLDSVLSSGVHMVGEVDHQLVGHGLLMPSHRPGVAEWAIFLAEGYRGRGIGTEMNRIAIDVGRALALTRIWLSVEPHNRPAVRSYEKVGYRFLSSAVFSTEAEMEIELEEGQK